MRGRVVDKAFAILTVAACSYLVIRVFIPFIIEVFGDGKY